ncbi:MAG: glutathione peroxidase [Sphingobacteriales bacterium]|jgi:glutathione peroxidase|nr:glutathione peroxidase [Sphingobacteriales bacterium]
MRLALNSFLYPLIRRIMPSLRLNAPDSQPITPPVSVYDLPIQTMDGSTSTLEAYKGRKILVVNTASECGFTPQYTEMQSLHETHADHIAVLAFPCNQFGAQEPGDNQAVMSFCESRFGVNFPVYAKCDVVGEHASPLFSWLSDPAQNGWNSQTPTWNFCKYVIDEEGRLLSVLGPSVSPLDPSITG